LKVFHERATEKTLAALERRVTVAGDQDLGGLTISETGYLELGHKNKHGGEYPAVPAENGPYLGKK